MKSKDEFIKRQQSLAVFGGGPIGLAAVSGDDPYGLKTSAYRACMEDRGYCSDKPPSWRPKERPAPAGCKG